MMGYVSRRQEGSAVQDEERAAVLGQPRAQTSIRSSGMGSQESIPETARENHPRLRFENDKNPA